MTPTLHTVGLVVQDMAKALHFYRTLGLAIAEGEEHSPHVEYVASNGFHIGFVSAAMVRQTDPQWTGGFGNRVNLQFDCGSVAEVDAALPR